MIIGVGLRVGRVGSGNDPACALRKYPHGYMKIGWGKLYPPGKSNSVLMTPPRIPLKMHFVK